MTTYVVKISSQKMSLLKGEDGTLVSHFLCTYTSPSGQRAFSPLWFAENGCDVIAQEIRMLSE